MASDEAIVVNDRNFALGKRQGISKRCLCRLGSSRTALGESYVELPDINLRTRGWWESDTLGDDGPFFLDDNWGQSSNQSRAELFWTRPEQADRGARWF